MIINSIVKIIFHVICISVLFSCNREIESPTNLNELPIYKNKISGYVKDSVLNRNIIGAELTLHPSKISVFTDSSGYFEFLNLDDDEYILQADRQYYHADTVNVDLINNDSMQININLKRIRAEFYNFSLNFAEGYTDNSTPEIPRIFLNMKTKLNFECSNYIILTQNSFQNNLVGINFVRIDLAGGVCITSIGPAVANILFNVSKGYYSISIYFEDVEDKYTLRVTDSSLVVEQVKNYFTELEFYKYWRKPENSFVYLCGTTSKSGWIYDDFIDTLKSKVALTEFTFPEDGIKPYPDSTAGHDLNHPARYFKYINDSDFESMELILENYSSEVIGNMSGVALSLRNWKNQFYYSWDKK